MAATKSLERLQVAQPLGPVGLGAGICLSITHGFQARNLLQTDVLPLLLEAGYHVTIIGPASGSAEFQAAFRRPGVRFSEVVAKPGRLADFFGSVRRYALANPKRNATYNLFNEKFLHSRKPRYVVLRALNRLLGRRRALRDGWTALESALIPGRAMEAVLRKASPALLVTGTPGTEHLDALLLRAARRLGIPTLCVVLSWDNLTSKGHMAVRPDRLVVWNERMRQEAVELHDYNPDEVDVAGVAHFDVYARPEQQLSGSAVCRRLGLDPARMILVFGTVSPYLFRYNLEVAELLARAVADGRISPPAQLVVRLHPQSISGIYADDVKAYRRLQEHYAGLMALDLPRVISSGLQWALPDDEMIWLASLLKRADVSLTVGSTLAIDAALCDTPIVGVAFDGFQRLPYRRSIRRTYDYTHYRPLVETGGLRLAENEEQMIELVNRYLSDRDLDSDGRARIVREQAWKLDGRSGERVAQLIAANARRGRSVACPVCGSQRSMARFQARDPHYGNPGWWWERECSECRSLFLDPMPTPSEISGFYPEEDYYAYRPASERSPLKQAMMTLLGCRPGTREPHFERPGRLLDFGCGAGDFMAQWRARGWDCHGVEVSERAIAAARARGLDVRRTIGEYAEATFEYVRANHSLEHVLDPPAIIREMYRVLKPGGTLFLGVPTRDGLPARVFGRYWWYLGAPVHPVTFSTNALTKLLRSVGLQPTRVATNSDYGSTAGSLQIFLNRHTSRRSSEGALFQFKPALALGHWAARALDLVGQGDKLEVVAIKPER
jgi:SAM-dependent methyltransferase